MVQLLNRRRRSGRKYSVASWLISFETAFGLFLFAGYYKGDTRLLWVPFDLTLFFFFLSVWSGVTVLMRKQFVVPKAGFAISCALFAFIAWMLVSILWSPGRQYAVTKFALLSSFVLWAGIAPALIIVGDRERVLRLFTVMLALFLWIDIEAILLWVRSGGTGERGFLYGLGGATYHSVSRAAAFGLCVALAFLLNSSGAALRTFFLGLNGVFAFTLLTAGGRGPLLGSIMASFAAFLACVHISKRRLAISPTALALLVALSAIFGGAIIVSGEKTQTLNRFITAADEDRPDASYRARIQYYRKALELGATAPLIGNGLGSWPILVDRRDAQGYPHNIILEILVEGGLLGLLFFCLFIVVAVRQFQFRRADRDRLRLATLLMFISAITIVQFSGDLVGNRFLFAMIALLAITPGHAEVASYLERSLPGSAK